MAVGLVLSAIGSIYSGVTSMNAANAQAEDMEAQGLTLLNESMRDAAIIREEGRNFAANQTLQFIGAGVQIMGSALITPLQTMKYAEAEAQATESSGMAKYNLASKSAKTTRSEGRASLVGGILNAGASLLSE